jgi:hypothetical protein
MAEQACTRVTRNLTPDEWLQFIGEDRLSPFEWLFLEDFTEYREICPGKPIAPLAPTGDPSATARIGGIARWEPPVQRSGRAQPTLKPTG